MTSTLSPSDTGEIELGGETTRLSEYAAKLPPTQALRLADATGEIFMPRFPAVPGDQLQPIFPLKRVLDPAVDDVEVILLRRSVPYVFPEGYTSTGRPGRHRSKALRSRLAALVTWWVRP